uniref:B30.2/SPRY domain-containing protein n=1 Tax=Xenopus tropicalis TaxID=8364 RepID=A0A1B8Y5B3_XENTR
MEELCNLAGTLGSLLAQGSDGAALCGAEGADNEGREADGIMAPGLADTVLGIRRLIYGQEATDLVLDINTAHNHVSVSGDRKSASYSLTKLHYPQSPERFQDYPQALSSRSFPSGRHYWEVEGSESGNWRVGAAYPSIERGGGQSGIGYNNKSWGLYRRYNNRYSERHDSKWTQLPHVPSCRRIRIWLDYEAGRLSFYELSEPIRRLHTFTASFTEPLHAAFWVSIQHTITAAESFLNAGKDSKETRLWWDVATLEKYVELTVIPRGQEKTQRKKTPREPKLRTYAESSRTCAFANSRCSRELVRQLTVRYISTERVKDQKTSHLPSRADNFQRQRNNVLSDCSFRLIDMLIDYKKNKLITARREASELLERSEEFEEINEYLELVKLMKERIKREEEETVS